MVYTDQQLIQHIREMIVEFENEVVEFKEAKLNYSFKDIGKYFSALGNEANIRGKKESWLIFGVDNKGNILGSDYRKDGGLQNLKKEIVSGTNERMTFMEIYEVEIDGKRIVAVGTTSTRVLETIMRDNIEFVPTSGNTDIFIYPGYKFKCMDAIITNFHLPESTLIMLVSAFAGYENTMNAYKIAVEEEYRFFSFGDAMFIS